MTLTKFQIIRLYLKIISFPIKGEANKILRKCVDIFMLYLYIIVGFFFNIIEGIKVALMIVVMPFKIVYILLKGVSTYTYWENHGRYYKHFTEIKK